MHAAPITEKMKALLNIAGKVRQDGRTVTPEDVERARSAGADDKAIHDTVLIAAAFLHVQSFCGWTGDLGPRQIPKLIKNQEYGSPTRVISAVSRAD